MQIWCCCYVYYCSKYCNSIYTVQFLSPKFFKMLFKGVFFFSATWFCDSTNVFMCPKREVFTTFIAFQNKFSNSFFYITSFLHYWRCNILLAILLWVMQTNTKSTKNSVQCSLSIYTCKYLICFGPPLVYLAWILCHMNRTVWTWSDKMISWKAGHKYRFFFSRLSARW